MLFVAVFSLLVASAGAQSQPHYSFSGSVGKGSGDAFTLEGDGRITAVRVWENYNNAIRGIQFRFGYIWSAVAGLDNGTPQELELFEGEFIVQVSGKYATNLQSVVFTTNQGRSLYVGQPIGNSFNMYPDHPNAELIIVSGRYNTYITSLGAHWATVDPSYKPSSNSTDTD